MDNCREHSHRPTVGPQTNHPTQPVFTLDRTTSRKRPKQSRLPVGLVRAQSKAQTLLLPEKPYSYRTPGPLSLARHKRAEMVSSASHVKAAASRLANAVWSAAASATARGASTSSANTAVATATTRRGLHTSARRHGGPDKGFWTEGTNVKEPGYLFGETPPPPGQSRKWESWELPWYSMMLLSGGILTVGLSVQPDTSIHTWAHKEALRRMEEGK